MVTVAEQVAELQQQDPSLPTRNFLVEPQPRGTAAVVAMAASAIHKVDPLAVLVVLTADHLIPNITGFQNYLKAACAVAEQGFIGTLGIQPTYPATGYGYIESGDSLGVFQAFGLLKLNGLSRNRMNRLPNYFSDRKILPGIRVCSFVGQMWCWGNLRS